MQSGGDGRRSRTRKSFEDNWSQHVCVYACVCVCWIAGGRDGRQGCKGEEVARKQRERRKTDMLFGCIVCTEALEAGETTAAKTLS